MVHVVENELPQQMVVADAMGVEHRCSLKRKAKCMSGSAVGHYRTVLRAPSRATARVPAGELESAALARLVGGSRRNGQ